MRFPFTASEDSVSIFLNGRMNTLAATAARFDELVEHLKLPDHDAIFIESIIDRPRAVSRLTCGDITVVGSTVFHKGIPAHSALCTKLVSMLDAGFDATPWALFFDNLMQNPSNESRLALYAFLDKWNVPFTEDGYFVAFKYVRDDYTDGYSGMFDNTPGKTVWMARIDVDPDPTQTCSRGLHVCASVYLEGYNGQKRIVACKVNPRDVVAVPNDYQHAKMRVCEYVVLCDVIDPNSGGFAEIEKQAVFTPHPIDTGIAAVDDTLNDYDADGFNSAGYDTDGYDMNGVDPYGYDRSGYDGDGLDESGLDSSGRDEDGFDGSGRDEDGFDETGFDSDGYDRDGYDADGYNSGGFHISVDALADIPNADFDEGINMFSTPDTDTKSVGVPSVGDGVGYVELIFARGSEVFTASLIVAGVNEWGQRAFALKSGVPRSTLQGWLNTIRNAGV